MKYCENCGAQLEDHAKFCEECGTKVEIEEVPQPKKKNKTPLIIGIVVVLILGIGGGAFYYMNQSQTKETPKQETVEKKTEEKTLKERLQWSDNQDTITTLKNKEFESKPIGRVLDAQFSPVSYQCANENHTDYLYCDFNFDGNPIVMIFKIGDSVELAEMYSENKLADDNTKESYIENIFYSDLAEQSMVATYMPTNESYCNSLLTDGVPYTCEIDVSKKSNMTFSFSINERFDGEGFRNYQTIFDEHIATFESVDSRVAKCQNGNMTITFRFNDDGSFTLSGFREATLASNQYSADNFVFGY